METPKSSPEYHGLMWLTALVSGCAVVIAVISFPIDNPNGLIFCLSIPWVVSFYWINSGKDPIRRAALAFCTSLVLAFGKFLWTKLPGNWLVLIPLLGGFAYLSYLFLNSFLSAVAELLWTGRLPGLDPNHQRSAWHRFLYAQEEVLWYIAIGRLQLEGSAGSAYGLMTAVRNHPNPRARAAALQALGRFRDREAIDAVCGMWAAIRDADLANLLIRRRWHASAPPEILVLSALLLGELDLLYNSAPERIEPLTRALQDADPLIAERAGQVLRGLKNVEAQEALCRLVIEQENPAARAVALSAGYLPRDEQQLALFLFMTEQWEQYAAHDFDRQLMHLAYTSAAGPLQQRIREKLRAAGRIDFLSIIAGEGSGERASEFNASEGDVLVQTLTANRNWAALWRRVFDLPFRSSLRAIAILSQSGWKPENAQEETLFAELAGLATEDLLKEASQMWELLPLSIMQQATIHSPAPIYSVAFSPLLPILAIGTGRGKVLLWNYQNARYEGALADFNHPIGAVAFSHDGTLLCAEHTNLETASFIHAFPDLRTGAASFCLGNHAGSVTALVPVSGSRLLSAGRDWSVALWDIPARKKIRHHQLGDWARGLRVSSDGTQALALHKEVDLFSLPEMEDIARIQSDVSFRSAAFAPGGQSVFIGTYSGKLLVYQKSPEQNNLFTAEQKPVTEYGPFERVEAVEVLNRFSLLMSAGTEGEMRFFSIDDYTPLGSLAVPGRQITSLSLLPDESFLAFVSDETTLTIWDLHIVIARLLLEQPLAQAKPAMVPMLNALLSNARLSGSARRVLQFAQAILRHRFRYAIEIAEAPSLALGEFDIEID